MAKKSKKISGPKKKTAKKIVKKAVVKKTKKPVAKKPVAKKNVVKKTIVKKAVTKKQEKKKESGWTLLRELALHTPYTMGYLSLMARRKQLTVKKINGIWYSTLENIKEFEERMKKQKEARSEQLRKKYREKVKKVNIKIIENKAGANRPVVKPLEMESPLAVERAMHGGGEAIFDEIQSELAEVLENIRNKEKRIKQGYIVHRGGGKIGGKKEKIMTQGERRETEKISEKLIEEMSKLLNTANQIHSNETSKAIRNNEKDIVALGNIASSFESKNPNSMQEDDDRLLGNHQPDNFLSVPYSYFPFEHREEEADLSDRNSYDVGKLGSSVSTYEKVLLFVSGILAFAAAVLLAMIIFG